MPSPDTREPAGTGELAAAFTRFAAGRCGNYAPLYACLASGIAGDPQLLALAAHASPGQSQPDLMLAAVHYLLAREPGSPLARHYPTLHPRPEPPGGAFTHFRDFCLAYRDELATLIAGRRVQTNEARRCCYLYPAASLAATLTVPRPLALIEAGASAGLNLALDGYAYDYGTGTITGNPGSSLTLRCKLRGPAAPPLDMPAPAIAWRVGIDISRMRRVLRLHRPARKIPPLLINRVHQQHPALPVLKKRSRRHPLARQRGHVLIRGKHRSSSHARNTSRKAPSPTWIRRHGQRPSRGSTQDTAPTCENDLTQR